MTDHVLLSFGHGYVARALARRLIDRGWQVIGTTRSEDTAREIARTGAEPVLWPGTEIGPYLDRATHLLTSIAPQVDGDPVLDALRAAIVERAERFAWAGYLSTTGVYGDRAGGWVNETSPCEPTGARGQRRLDAELGWRAIDGLPVHIFRIAGIYGPGRSPLDRVAGGRAQRIVKPGQVFSRIHVEDIASVLAASIDRPNPGAIYNVCDDEAAPPQDVIAHAAHLLGLPVPPGIPFEEAELSDMARSFYADSKLVSNRRIREELGVDLAYPTYREGLQALLEDETPPPA